MGNPWRISAQSFFLGSSSALLYGLIWLRILPAQLSFYIEDRFIVYVVIHVIIVNFVLVNCFHSQDYQVAVRGGALGSVFAVALIISLTVTEWQTFAIYWIFLCLFHWSEYLVQAYFNPQTTTCESYLLYHSTPYVVAAVTSWCEYGVEKFFLPEIKTTNLVSSCGLALIIGGDLLRKLAMIQAKSNFNHYVQYRRAEGHELVTSGVYAWCRHPSYVGWFYWSIGTQLLLCNPICTVVYTAAAWMFFKERVESEEATLVYFFGEKYIDYKRNVASGLPFIRGVDVAKWQHQQ